MTRSCKKRLPRAPASLSSPTRSATIAMPLLVLSLLPPARSGGSTQDGDQRRPLVILLGTASGLVARTREVGLGERRAHSCILFFESVRSWTGHSMQRRIVCPPSLQSISCEHDSGLLRDCWHSDILRLTLMLARRFGNRGARPRLVATLSADCRPSRMLLDLQLMELCVEVAFLDWTGAEVHRSPFPKPLPTLHCGACLGCTRLRLAGPSLINAGRSCASVAPVSLTGHAATPCDCRANS